MSLGAKLSMCPFKNCLASYFARMSISRKSISNVFVIKCHYQMAIVFSISVCLLVVCLLQHHGSCSYTSFHITVLPLAALSCRSVGKVSCKMCVVWKDALKGSSLKLMCTDSGCTMYGVGFSVFCCVFVLFPNDDCLAGILLFGISLLLWTLQWWCRRWS